MLARIGKRLAEVCGIDPATIAQGHIAAALRERMTALSVADAEAYLQMLLGSKQETLAFFELISIPESWFFRDRAPFELLAKEAVALRGKLGPGERVRILSLPCARGEEPYSAAIALIEAGVPASAIAVDAADLSASALETAQAGVYREGSFRDRPASSFGRLVAQTPEGYAVCPEVRALVRFFPANILDLSSIAAEHAYHFIFFRNVLIYLNEQGRSIAETRLEGLLAPGGLLFLGHSDAFGAGGNLFSAIRPIAAFAFRRRSEIAAEVEPASPPTPASAEKKVRRPRNEAEPRTERIASPPAAQSVVREPPADLKSEAIALANRGETAAALSACRSALIDNPTDAELQHLMGVLHQSLGDLHNAEARLLKALYLDPQHEEALWALALLARNRGDARAEADFRRRAARAAPRKAGP